MLHRVVLAAACASFDEVQLAVLFGSAARGAIRADSDLDVGVILSPDTPEARLRVEAALSRLCDRPLDLVFINDAPPQLRFEIAKGTPLFEREPGAWVGMKTAAMIDWWDWQPEARAFHRLYLDRLRTQVGM